jgi:hypothetical protein
MEGRRVRIVYVHAQYILDMMKLIHAAAVACDYFVVASTSDIPADAVIEQVFFDHTRNGFGFVVSHESFDLIAPCAMPPNVLGEFNAPVKTVGLYDPQTHERVERNLSHAQV